MNHVLANTSQVSAQIGEHLVRDAFALANQPQQDMFGTNIVVSQLQRFPHRQF